MPDRLDAPPQRDDVATTRNPRQLRTASPGSSSEPRRRNHTRRERERPRGGAQASPVRLTFPSAFCASPPSTAGGASFGPLCAPSSPSLPRALALALGLPSTAFPSAMPREQLAVNWRTSRALALSSFAFSNKP